jgi:hypothetical protein
MSTTSNPGACSVSGTSSSASIPGVERLVAWYRVSSSAGAVVALIGANLIPLAGVLFLGWNVWAILLLYWLENGVVGVYNVFRIMRAEGAETTDGSGPRVNGRPASNMSKASLVPFFCIHYGIFWIGHGFFVLLLPVFGGIGESLTGGFPEVGSDGFPEIGPDGLPLGEETTAMLGGVEPLGIAFALLALVISHGVSYWFNYIGRGEYLRATPSGQMFAPYGRLVVLHVTIIVGAVAIGVTGAAEVAVAILVALKILLDLGLHLAAHRPPSEAAASG